MLLQIGVMSNNKEKLSQHIVSGFKLKSDISRLHSCRLKMEDFDTHLQLFFTSPLFVLLLSGLKVTFVFAQI